MSIEVPHYGFPGSYDENYLVLLVRDPHCIFAYWEFSREQRDLVAGEFGCSWGEVNLIMRVYDLTGLNFDGDNAHGFFDVGIHPLANNHYIKNVRPNNSYCVDLGVITRDGRFVTLLRSNVVHTPRDSMADGSGIVWADLLERLPRQSPEDGAETFSSEGVYLNTGRGENEDK